MSAFAMMFFQDPSMREFQTRLRERTNLNNLKTLFVVSGIPKATRLRDVVDELPSRDLLLRLNENHLCHRYNSTQNIPSSKKNSGDGFPAFTVSDRIFSVPPPQFSKRPVM